jgi:AraC-like DNA-binding protein
MQTIPLSSFPILETSDSNVVVDAVRTYFHDADVDLQKTNFRLIFNRLDLGRISLNGIGLSDGYRIKSEPMPDCFVLFLMLSGEKHVKSTQAVFSCRAGKLAALLDFSEPTALVQEKGYANLVLRFTRQGLEDSLVALTGQPVRTRLVFANPVDLSQPGPRRFARITRQVAEVFEKDPGLATSPLLAARYEELLLTAMLTCLEHNHGAALAREARPEAPKVVKLSEDFIEANADKPLRLADLADLTGTGLRSLQMAFKKHRGYSPSRFLQECRLAKARRILRQSEPGMTILSVAQACGFASQGFFSKLYRQRFGEKPSETLRRR